VNKIIPFRKPRRLTPEVLEELLRIHMVVSTTKKVAVGCLRACRPFAGRSIRCAASATKSTTPFAAPGLMVSAQPAH